MGIHRIRPAFQSRDFEFVTDIMFQIEAFRTYINATQATIEVDIKNEIAKYEKIMKEEEEQYLEMGFDFNEMEILEHTSVLYYSSIFISISSFLEKKMFQLCRVAEKKHAAKINSIPGTGIYKYYQYLTQVVGLDLTKLDEEWNNIVAHSRFRNKLVHEPENPDSESPNSYLTVDGLHKYLSLVFKLLNDITHEHVHPDR